MLTLPTVDLKGRVTHGVGGQEPLDPGSQKDILKEGYQLLRAMVAQGAIRQLKLSPVTVARTTSITEAEQTSVHRQQSLPPASCRPSWWSKVRTTLST